MTDREPAGVSRSRTGGRRARLEARTGRGAAPEAPAFIRRQIPTYELPGEDGLALIETKADQLLAEVGIEVHDDVAVGLFRDALVRRGFLGIGSKESLRFSLHTEAFDELVRHERIYQKRDEG